VEKWWHGDLVSEMWGPWMCTILGRGLCTCAAGRAGHVGMCTLGRDNTEMGYGLELYSSFVPFFFFILIRFGGSSNFLERERFLHMHMCCCYYLHWSAIFTCVSNILQIRVRADTKPAENKQS
jgi:hypothetical protein